MKVDTQLLKLLTLAQIVICSVFASASGVCAASSSLPPTAPTITYVSRTLNSLSINFKPGLEDPTTRYQYTLDDGQTWKYGTRQGNSILVSDVQPEKRYAIAIRGVNEIGIGPSSFRYSKRVALFIGASITAGSGGDGNGWAFQVAENFGWQIANLATGGTGFNEPKSDTSDCNQRKNFISQMNCGLRFQPDLVIVSGGINDCKKQSELPNSTRNKVIFTYSFLRAKLPKAILIGTPVLTFSQNNCITELNSVAAKITAAISANYVAGAETWLAGHRSWTNDSLHPNQTGHRKIAKLFIEWMRGKKLY